MNFFITLILFSLLIIGMAIGLIIKQKPLKKGCSTEPDQDCPICHKKPQETCLNKADTTSN